MPVKRVREWVQVACRPFGGNNPTKPKWKAEKIDVVKGKGKDVTSEVKGGVAKLTFPLREGMEVNALVEYSKGGPKKVVDMKWEKGAVGASLKLRTGM